MCTKVERILVQARNRVGKKRNPIALSETHWTSLSKGLDGPIPVTSHTFLSSGTSSPCMHLSIGDFSMPQASNQVVVTKCYSSIILITSLQ